MTLTITITIPLQIWLLFRVFRSTLSPSLIWLYLKSWAFAMSLFCGGILITWVINMKKVSSHSRKTIPSFLFACWNLWLSIYHYHLVLIFFTCLISWKLGVDHPVPSVIINGPRDSEISIIVRYKDVRWMTFCYLMSFDFN